MKFDSLKNAQNPSDLKIKMKKYSSKLVVSRNLKFLGYTCSAKSLRYAIHAPISMAKK